MSSGIEVVILIGEVSRSRFKDALSQGLSLVRFDSSLSTLP